MAFDVGSIESTLELDRDPFQAELDAAQESASQFVAEPFTATLGLDDAEASASLAEFQAQWDALGPEKTLVINVVSDDGSGGLGGLGDQAAAADTDLENLGTQADSAVVSLDNLGASADEQIASLGSIGAASSLAADDVGGLSSSVGALGVEAAGLETTAVPATEALSGLGLSAADLGLSADAGLASLADLDEGVLDFGRDLSGIGQATGDAASYVDVLAQSEAAAGLAAGTLATSLSRAGVTAADMQDEADSAGVSIGTFAEALARAVAAGNNMTSFWQALQQGDVSWNHYAEDGAGAANVLAAGMTRVSGSVQAVLQTDPALSLWTEQATEQLVAMGLAGHNVGGDLLDMNGDVTTSGALFRQFGIVLNDGQVSVGGINQAVKNFATDGLAESDAGLTSSIGYFQSYWNITDQAAAAQRAFTAGMAESVVGFDALISGMDDLDATTLVTEGGVTTLVNSLDDLFAAEDEIAQLSGGGGGGGGGGIGSLATSFLKAGQDASSLWEAVGAGMPIIAAVVTEGVGGFLALAGAATIGLTGIGVGVLALIPDLSQMESAVEDAYDGWQAMTGAAGLMEPVVQGLGTIVTNVLDDITPLLKPVEQAFMDVENVIEEVSQSPDLKQFVSWLGTAMGPTATTFATTVANFMAGLGNMLEASWPFIQMVENGMVSLSADFDKFSQSNGFQEFIVWLQQNAGQVASFISGIVGVVEALWEGFAKLATIFLPIVDGVLDLVNAFLRIPGAAEVVAGLVVVLSALALLATPLLAVGAAIGVLTGASAAAGAGIAAGLGVAAAAVVGLVAVAGVAAYEIVSHWSDIESAADDVGDWFSNSLPHFFESGYDDIVNSTGTAIDGLKSGWDDLTSSASATGNWFSQSLPQFFESGFESIYGFATSIFDDVISFFESLPAKMLQIGVDIIDGLGNGLKEAWDDVFGWIQSAAGGIETIFKDILGIFSPSTVMMAIGESTMEGLGIGLQNGFSAHVSGVLANSAAQVAGAFGGTATTGTASLVATLAAAPTSPSGPVSAVTVAPVYNTTINGADLSNVPALQGAMSAALKAHDADLMNRIVAKKRGHL